MSPISSINMLTGSKSLAFCGSKKQVREKSAFCKDDINLNLQPNSLPSFFVKLRKNKQKTEISTPKGFVYNHKAYKKSDIVTGNIQYKYIENSEDIHYRKEVCATPLPVIEEMSSSAMYIDNFTFPKGTIAIPAVFDETLVTGDLLQCVGIGIVDKKKNIQTLVHYCPTVNEKSNKDLLKYLLSKSELKDVEISLVPGCDEDTDNSLRDVINTLEEVQEEKNQEFKSINFKYFRDNDFSFLVLHNGNLSCISYDDLQYSGKNPKNRIVYASIYKVRAFPKFI